MDTKRKDYYETIFKLRWSADISGSPIIPLKQPEVFEEVLLPWTKCATCWESTAQFKEMTMYYTSCWGLFSINFCCCSDQWLHKNSEKETESPDFPHWWTSLKNVWPIARSWHSHHTQHGRKGASWIRVPKEECVHQFGHKTFDLQSALPAKYVRVMVVQNLLDLT